MAEKNATRQKRQQRVPSTATLLKQNAWNPFDRVDPKVLERIHNEHKRQSRLYLLTNMEDAVI
jgi:hypothetical protein